MTTSTLASSCTSESVPPACRVSVKTLCAFSAKRGDIDLRFVPSPTAQQGMAGHVRVQARRGAGYESEVVLRGAHGPLQVRGRADGYDTARGRVEEIKTFRGRFDAIRDNHRALHWAQAKVYGWLLCERDALAHIDVALVYLDLGTDEETVLEERCTREALALHFEGLCAAYAAWAQSEAAHHAALSGRLASLAFPHAAFRNGQRDIADAVYRAAAAARHLLIEAPTGIGKTLATLFPMLKARAQQKLDKVYFLTAKTSGRAIALEALQQIVGTGASLRVLELTARDKVCEHPGKACNGEACPLARGFYDRLAAARAQAVQTAWLDRAALRRIALAHDLCPYFLSQELVRWSDVIVGDYNHYFDTSAFLYALMKEEDWQVALLVDEAHNLVQRARGMYTAVLDGPALDRVRRHAPAALRLPLQQVERAWRSVQDAQGAAYALHAEVPDALPLALQGAVAAMGDHFAAHPEHAQGPLQQFFFDAIQFARLADAFADHSVFESTLDAAAASGMGDTGEAGARGLAIRNLLPAPFLQSRFAACRASACFSGTLAPFDFYRQTLGMPGNTATLRVGSPFRSEQLAVRVVDDLSTRFRDRARTLGRLVDLMAAQIKAQPGNYMAFFSSFDYLERAVDALGARHPGVPMWAQTRGMTEGDRHAFLARLRPGGCGIAFAVLGGAFGEGVDLPGDRLIGAFIASLGLPQHNLLNETLRERMEARFGDGWAYAYLYPGLQKVVQAAGRVIRTEQDVGVLYLMDDRFSRPEVRALLPPWWDVQPLVD
ncbi:helicase C-terminal domain-containing protein [Variovorax ginsengisoli]|uniref:DNA excision repair protein ERCC-2 n=1 Tax=Variovorax ginsengisoli TaxID=363844 RepID=A0ABT9SEX4_9BURK|nr:helicase C-terminal domain-containing protein [Variovorax ginsengisoli]MDP9902918.1 DNA excision repair protein ERCC-2 [Variovorax ginsengisoli]